MNIRKWFRITNQLSILGWFPFMWVALFAKGDETWGLIVFLGGIFLCMFMSVVTMFFYSAYPDIFKDAQEIKDLKIELKERIQAYEKATNEFVKTFKNK